MQSPPSRLDLVHFKEKAARLLRDARTGSAEALRRFVERLPAADDIEPSARAQRELRLHDAQSVVAREHGFGSWVELERYVGWQQAASADRLKTWAMWVFDGNVMLRRLAMRALREDPDAFDAEPWCACAIGDAARVRAALARDAGWANRPIGPFSMPPLVVVTHSRLVCEDAFESELIACAEALLRHGADVNGTWTDPHSPDARLSVLYGAAGRTHHAGMTKRLLDAGADPDDDESLYHSVECRDPACTRLLLGAGAHVVRTNAIARTLDYDDLDRLQLLLRHGGDAKERPWIHHAILRGRSLGHIRALAEAGADLRATNAAGVSLCGFAQTHGRVDVVELLKEFGVEEEMAEEVQFVAACARGNEREARLVADRTPNILQRLGSEQLQTMPQLAAVGDIRAVRTMLTLGWPREIKTAWDATALNLAVYQGDAAMAQLLLEQGADWRTPHGFGRNVLGTLSFASQADDIEGPAPQDYAGCARALLANGVPQQAFEGLPFSTDVSEILDRMRSADPT